MSPQCAQESHAHHVDMHTSTAHLGRGWCFVHTQPPIRGTDGLYKLGFVMSKVFQCHHPPSILQGLHNGLPYWSTVKACEAHAWILVNWYPTTWYTIMHMVCKHASHKHAHATQTHMDNTCTSSLKPISQSTASYHHLRHIPPSAAWLLRDPDFSSTPQVQGPLQHHSAGPLCLCAHALVVWRSITLAKDRNATW